MHVPNIYSTVVIRKLRSIRPKKLQKKSSFENNGKIFRKTSVLRSYFNPFVPNAPFLYSMKTSFCFQGAAEEYIGKKWVNKIVKWRPGTFVM